MDGRSESGSSEKNPDGRGDKSKSGNRRLRLPLTNGEGRVGG